MFLAKPLELKNLYEDQESCIFYFELISSFQKYHLKVGSMHFLQVKVEIKFLFHIKMHNKCLLNFKWIFPTLK